MRESSHFIQNSHTLNENQGGEKKVMKKGLSLLLAASMALSTFATAASAADLTAEEKFEALKAQGIFTGFEDGSAGLDQSMTRAQVAAIITRLLDLQENASAAASYNDLVGAEWAAGYIGAVTPTYMEGLGGGKFDPSGSFTLEQLATVMVRVLDLEVDEEAEVDGNVSDWAAGYVAAAIEAGIISESSDYTVPAIREALVEATYTANDIVNVPAELTVSATPVGAGTIQLDFNKAVENATISVKRGATAVNINETVYADDKKSATIKFSNSLAVGDYTVTVTVGEDDESTASFEIMDEIVASIEFSGVAVQLNRSEEVIQGYLDLFGITDLDAEEIEPRQVVIAHMTMLNQYGEDVTKDYDKNDFDRFEFDDADTNDIYFDADTGLIWLPNEDEDNWERGDTLGYRVTYENDDDDNTEVTVRGDLEIVEASEVAGIEILGLYHNDEEDSTFSFDDNYEDWYLMVEAIDQYGQVIKNPALLDDEIRVDVDNDDIFRVASVREDDDYGFERKEIHGKTYTVIHFLEPVDLEDKEAGTNVVTMRANGVSASIDVVVTDEIRIDTIRLSQPTGPVVGAEVSIPFVALDLDGEEVWDANILDIYSADNTDGGLRAIEGRASGNSEVRDLFRNNYENWIKFRENAVTGRAELIVDLSDPEFVAAAQEVFDRDRNVEIELTIETYTEKETELVFTVKEGQEIKGISGVSVDANYLVGYRDNIKLKDITFVDQGGNVMHAREMFNRTATPDDGSYTTRVIVETKNTNYITLSGAHSVSNSVYMLNDLDDEIWLNAGTTKGNVSVEFKAQQLVDGRWRDFGNASYTLRARVVEMSDIESFTASVPDAIRQNGITGNAGDFYETLEDAGGYASEVEVKGVLSNGGTVAIPARYFTATATNSGLKLEVSNGNSHTGYKIWATELAQLDKADATIKVPVNVVVDAGRSGPKVVSTEATVSNAAPEITTMKLDANLYTAGQKFEVKNNVLYIEEDFVNGGEANLKAAIIGSLEAKDQYDEKLTVAASDFSVVTANFTSKDRESLAQVRAGDTFNATVLANSGVVLEFRVSVVRDGYVR